MEAAIQIQEIPRWAQQRHGASQKFSALKEAGTKQGHLRGFGMDLLPHLIKHTDWDSASFKLHDAAWGTYRAWDMPSATARGRVSNTKIGEELTTPK